MIAMPDRRAVQILTVLSTPHFETDHEETKGHADVFYFLKGGRSGLLPASRDRNRERSKRISNCGVAQSKSVAASKRVAESEPLAEPKPFAESQPISEPVTAGS